VIYQIQTWAQMDYSQLKGARQLVHLTGGWSGSRHAEASGGLWTLQSPAGGVLGHSVCPCSDCLVVCQATVSPQGPNGIIRSQLAVGVTPVCVLSPLRSLRWFWDKSGGHRHKNWALEV